jgi:transcriptional regulator with XRE-family HTH domain
MCESRRVQVDGKLIRHLRKTSGMSATHLAQQVEITPQFLSDIEHGRRGVHETTALKIAALLGVDLGQIRPPADKGVAS